MALLTTGNFYTATFLPTTNAAYAALGTQPYITSQTLAAAIYKAVPSPVMFYVIDSASGNIACVDGQAFGMDDTILDGAAVALTGFVLDSVSGAQNFFGGDGTGVMVQYDQVAGLLRTYAGGEVTAFKAFVAAV